MKYYVAIDQGTTSTRIFLYGADDLKVHHTFKREHRQYLGNHGEVEHDAQEIWQQIEEMLVEVQPFAQHLLGIGITNQRETFLLFNQQGQPLTRALVWQDKRTSSWCQQHREAFKNINGENGEELTGLPLDPYFSASKLRWLLDHHPELLKQRNSDQLLFGTMDTFLLYKLTGGKVHATDVTNASRTQLMNLSKLQWDTNLKEFFLGQHHQLIQWPQILPSLHDFGTAKIGTQHVPITCLLGDQQAALIGSGALEPGQAKMTFGTGAFYLQNVGPRIPKPVPGLLRTVAYQTNQSTVHYALEGSLLAAGSLITWLKDQLQLIADGPEINHWVGKINPVVECKDQFFYPYLAGAGSPHWQPDWRGAWIGINLASSKDHLCYLVLESLAFATKELLQATGQQVSELRVDGGLANSDAFLQLLATVCETKIIRRTGQVEATALGAAMGARANNEEIKITKIVCIGEGEVAFNPSKNLEMLKIYHKKWHSWIHGRKYPQFTAISILENPCKTDNPLKF